MSDLLADEIATLDRAVEKIESLERAARSFKWIVIGLAASGLCLFIRIAWMARDLFPDEPARLEAALRLLQFRSISTLEQARVARSFLALGILAGVVPVMALLLLLSMKSDLVAAKAWATSKRKQTGA